MDESMNLNGITPEPISNISQDEVQPISGAFVDNNFIASDSDVSVSNNLDSAPSIISEVPEMPSLFSENVNSTSSVVANTSNNSIDSAGLTPLSSAPIASTGVGREVNETVNSSVPEVPVMPQVIPVQDTNQTVAVDNNQEINTPVATAPVTEQPVVAGGVPDVGTVPVMPQAVPVQDTNQTVAVDNNQEINTPVATTPVAEQPAIAGGVPDVGAVPIDDTEQTDQSTGENGDTGNTHYAKNDSLFSSIEFGPLEQFLNDDNITDISYSNGGQVWLKTLDKGIYRVENTGIDDALMEKIAFQCSNVMGKSFNMAQPFLDSESAELRMNFVHDSIAKNGIAAVFRKTPAKIRLEKEKIIADKYVTANIHDFLIKCVQGHCNMIVSGETGSGKTELVKYLASHTAENEKLITIEDTLELHLDRIFPHRDIVAMKTNNIASYSDVLVTCMRQNPKWILLSEVRSAEAVTAVRNSISSGHNILSTIHSDKAVNIPHRLYSLLESNIDVDQFLKTIYRYIQLGIFVRGRFDPAQKRFVREIAEVTEFYVDDDNCIGSNTIYIKTVAGVETYKPVSKYLKSYLEGQGVDIKNLLGDDDIEINNEEDDNNDIKKEEVETLY